MMKSLDVLNGACEYKRKHGAAPKLVLFNPEDAQGLGYSLTSDPMPASDEITVEEARLMNFHIDESVPIGTLKFL